MRNNKTSNSVYLAIRNNETGITLLSTLFALTVLMTTLPLIPVVFKALEYDTGYTEYSTRQFFSFLLTEFHDTNKVTLHDSTLQLNKRNNETVQIDQYQDIIRRQVNNRGHEIMLRDVKQITFYNLSFGLRVKITTLEGKEYEKTFRLADYN